MLNFSGLVILRPGVGRRTSRHISDLNGVSGFLAEYLGRKAKIEQFSLRHSGRSFVRRGGLKMTVPWAQLLFLTADCSEFPSQRPARTNTHCFQESPSPVSAVHWAQTGKSAEALAKHEASPPR